MQLAENLLAAKTPISNLRFLEYSIPCENVLHSLEFFQNLGFAALATNDIRSYPYAVVTDGRCFLGLHEKNHFSKLSNEPRFSFVHDEISPIVRYLNDNRYDVTIAQIDEDAFQQTVFRGPNVARINILAARCFSPPLKENCKDSELGNFRGIVAPTSNLEKASQFWENLELLVMPSIDESSISVSTNRLKMLLVDNTEHQLPGLLFEHEQPETLFPLFARLGMTLEVSEQHMILGSEYRLKTPDNLHIWIKRSA